MSIRVICHRAHSVPLVVSLRTIYQLEIYDSSQQTEPQQQLVTICHGTAETSKHQIPNKLPFATLQQEISAKEQDEWPSQLISPLMSIIIIYLCIAREPLVTVFQQLALMLGALNLLFRKVRVYCLLVNSNNSTHSVAHCNLRLFHHFFLSQFNNTMHDVPTSRRFFLAHCITFCSVIYVSVRMGLRKSINCYNPVCVGHLTTSSIHDTLP